MTSDVVFRASAQADLDAITVFIAERSGVARAETFVERIEARCRNLGVYPRSGRLREELGTGFRAIALERRVLIVYAVAEGAVEIVRVFYGGRDVEALIGDEAS